MRMDGSFTVTAARQQVYAFLIDPERVVKVLPDVQSSRIESPEVFSVATRVGVGPMRGTVDMRFQIAQKEPNQRAVYKGQGSGMGSNVDMETGFTLQDAGGGTEVQWYGDAKIGGRLASVAGGLLEPLAKKNISTFVAAVQRGLEEGR
ncbi:MAG: carbon monoxide dehydrogenase subunit G [Chloroflexi bacterium]|nr:carbon monoxide dehydrogenase subunit G [Chloroflexota bacterium]